MKRLLLITGLLVALSGLIRSVDAQTSDVGYGSTATGEIYLIDLNNGTPSVDPLGTYEINEFGDTVDLNRIFQGIAIDNSGTTLYGVTQGGHLFSIDNDPASPDMGLIEEIGTIKHEGVNVGDVEAMDFNFDGTELLITDFQYPQATIYSVDTSDATAEVVQTLHPVSDPNTAPPGRTVPALSADTAAAVLIGDDGAR